MDEDNNIAVCHDCGDVFIIDYNYTDCDLYCPSCASKYLTIGEDDSLHEDDY